MAIHLVQRSTALVACKDAAASTDVIVLLGEGVAALTQVNQDGGSPLRSQPSLYASNLYASKVDVKERGFADQVPDEIAEITDEQLVELCAAHSPVVSWNRA